MKQRFFKASHCSADVCKASSSGGAFTAILEYGDKADAASRDRMRGSNDVGLDRSGVFRQVVDDLCAGSYVVFSGTPCQIDGLKSFLNVKGIDVADVPHMRQYALWTQLRWGWMRMAITTPRWIRKHAAAADCV